MSPVSRIAPFLVLSALGCSEPAGEVASLLPEVRDSAGIRVVTSAAPAWSGGET